VSSTNCRYYTLRWASISRGRQRYRQLTDGARLRVHAYTYTTGNAGNNRRAQVRTRITRHSCRRCARLSRDSYFRRVESYRAIDTPKITRSNTWIDGDYHRDAEEIVLVVCGYEKFRYLSGSRTPV